MHELSIAQFVVEACAERAEGGRILRVTLEIGKLAAVMPDALRFCFDVCARHTPLEGAALDIVELPGRAICRDCHCVVMLDDLLARCTCGSCNVEIVGGEELKVKEMEVA
ncbi:MAG: hydrogenase maturation nickel metallochaperone HypA [Acidisphaera sp.]|nr:hydrogenase maturation nickel metallochaperone HypA [Acidisphaera sp.]